LDVPVFSPLSATFKTIAEWRSETGKDFDVERRKSGIKNELEKGAVFVLIKKTNRLLDMSII
jgi:hypothetical protein